MGLTNFILECEKDNEQLRNDINYYKNFNKRLQKENKELKKQLEEANEKILLLQVSEPMLNYKKALEENQQKEFIEYMNKTIEELECYDVDDEEMKVPRGKDFIIVFQTTYIFLI